MNNPNNEPSLNNIDDFNGHESPSKKRTIYLVILGLLLVGAVYTYFKVTNNTVSDYIGTPSQPGIDLSKTTH